MITDTEARKIASAWHGGGGTALYAFASTGAIDTARADHDIEREIIECLWSADRSSVTRKDKPMLHELRRYTGHHGTRGPQPGWANLTW